jgi:chromosome partitioning protein
MRSHAEIQEATSMEGARVIAAANLKGGVGKSTLTINLATAMEATGVHTGIIDIDAEQQAAARWKDARGGDKPPIVVSPVHTRLPQAIADLTGRGIKLIFVDCPAFARGPTERAIEVADLVLIPCRATVQDLQFVEQTVDMAAAREKPTAIVLNAVETQVRETDEARAYLEKQGIALAPTHLSKAVVYHRAITAALGATEYDPSSKAAHELLDLCKWISILLGMSEPPRAEKKSRRQGAEISAPASGKATSRRTKITTRGGA